MDIRTLDRIEIFFTVFVLAILCITPPILLLLTLIIGDMSFLIPFTVDLIVSGALIWKLER